MTIGIGLWFAIRVGVGAGEPVLCFMVLRFGLGIELRLEKRLMIVIIASIYGWRWPVRQAPTMHRSRVTARAFIKVGAGASAG